MAAKEKQAERAESLRRELGERGAHLTRQRAAVFDYLSGVDHHPTAEEVYMAVKRKLPRISLATVYKNLEKLVECGAATKLTYGDAASRYDIRTDHHYHTRCVSCGELRDFESEKGLRLLRQLAPDTGFQVEDYRLELVGYCRACKGKGG